MKRFLLIAVTALLMVGCEKEAEIKADNRLVGTTYRTDGYASIMGPIFGHYYHSYEFSTEQDGVAYWCDKKGDQNGSDGNFTYKLEYPELYITKSDGEEMHYRFTDARSFGLVKERGEVSSSMMYYKQ